MSAKPEMTSVEIFSDGACSGNPGPGGYGAILRCGGREKEISGWAPETTNNRMELTAVIEALRRKGKLDEVTAGTKRPDEVEALVRRALRMKAK